MNVGGRDNRIPLWERRAVAARIWDWVETGISGHDLHLSSAQFDVKQRHFTIVAFQGVIGSPRADKSFISAPLFNVLHSHLTFGLLTAEAHTNYDGVAVWWGLTHNTESAADCCQACFNQAKATKLGEVNGKIWVFCAAENGCHSPDIYEPQTPGMLAQTGSVWGNVCQQCCP
ncbi:hypothetical protein SELMODRAFT_423876 [Selaginella moellendorffii]|uniref:Apple domain-containing protein n=1 Tax=Selaginella moellendorffii TaxID=88036 RepID=D8SN33_SELML|nr:hypothetical protein SELMODRAFT_423876 [Selaginella moellendorffii]